MSSTPNALPPAKRRRSPARRLMMIPAFAFGGYLGVRAAQANDPGWLLEFAGGVILALELHMLLYLALSRFTGMSAVTMFVGAGKWLGSTRVAGRLLVFRLLPVVPFSACTVLEDKPGRKWRLWSAALLMLIVESALAASMITSGAGIGVVFFIVVTLLSKPATPTSRFWTLFRLPFGEQERRLEEWAYRPAALRAVRELLAGRIGAARTALGEDDGTQRWLATASTLALAEGRFAEAAERANALYARSETARLKAGAHQVYAAAMADGVAAGHWQPHEALPRFAQTMQAIRDTLPLLLRAGDLGAIESLLKQSPKQAAKQAAYAASAAPDAVSRARALCTRAVALAYLGETGKARKVLAKAGRTAPGLDRVAVVGGLLDRTPVAEVTAS